MTGSLSRKWGFIGLFAMGMYGSGRGSKAGLPELGGLLFLIDPGLMCTDPRLICLDCPRKGGITISSRADLVKNWD